MALTLAGVTQLASGFSWMRISSGASISVEKLDDRHVGGDAVVVGRIALRDGERFAAAL